MKFDILVIILLTSFVLSALAQDAAPVTVSVAESTAFT